MNISVFGGSSPKPGSPAYQQGFILGKSLALAGHNVLTGGYIGTMEAVSRGAAEAGGHVIGVTCSEIENWRAVKANAWVHEERRFNTLQERLHELIYNCDISIALPGGPGTLAEISLTWNLMIINAIPEKPLILIGEEWQLVMSSFFKNLSNYIPPVQHRFLRFTKDVESACSMLKL